MVLPERIELSTSPLTKGFGAVSDRFVALSEESANLKKPLAFLKCATHINAR